MSRRTTSVGMGYNHFNMNRSLWTAGASNILTRLAARTVIGPAPPIQVHQHYGLELHLVLAGDSCIRRAFFVLRTCADSALSSKDVWRGSVRAYLQWVVRRLLQTKSNGVVGPYLHLPRLDLSVTVTSVLRSPR